LIYLLAVFSVNLIFYSVAIHDFGILKFDPAKIKYMKLTEIPLCPELAKVGLDIRVVGYAILDPPSSLHPFFTNPTPQHPNTPTIYSKHSLELWAETTQEKNSLYSPAPSHASTETPRTTET
jgi:hypothetical protein